MIRTRAGEIGGRVPYSVKLHWGFTVFKTDWYNPRKGIPYVTLEVTSLDYVRTAQLSLKGARLHFSWSKPKSRDEKMALHWSPTEGWTARGGVTGRRTRPLPKFIAAMLCGSLIWVYPDILRISLEHAEKASEPTHVYWLLVSVTVALVCMVGMYMWFCFKSTPTGLDKFLATLGNRSEGSERSPGSTRNTQTDSETDAADTGDARERDSSTLDMEDTQSKSPAAEKSKAGQSKG